MIPKQLFAQTGLYSMPGNAGQTLERGRNSGIHCYPFHQSQKNLDRWRQSHAKVMSAVFSDSNRFDMMKRFLSNRGGLPPDPVQHSSVAQWQSIRLLTGGL